MAEANKSHALRQQPAREPFLMLATRVMEVDRPEGISESRMQTTATLNGYQVKSAGTEGHKRARKEAKKRAPQQPLPVSVPLTARAAMPVGHPSGSGSTMYREGIKCLGAPYKIEELTMDITVATSRGP